MIYDGHAYCFPDLRGAGGSKTPNNSEDTYSWG